MPEFPDLTCYREALEARIVGGELERIRNRSPFLVRTFDPPLSDAHGRVVERVDLIGKRLVFGLSGDRHLVLHLMIAGRIRWKPLGHEVPKRAGLAAFDFAAGESVHPDVPGSLVLTEASKKKRASLHYVIGADALEPFDRGGLDVFAITESEFAERLTQENRTLKRALTDPRIYSGIGNAYSDEILHRAQLSPVQRTRNLAAAEIATLFAATRDVLTSFTSAMRDELSGAFPDKVTAFRDDMAVHGRFRKPCPVCGREVQRIKYADNELNYCPTCQTDGRLLADRGLSRLLKGDWPKTLDELELRRG